MNGNHIPVPLEHKPNVVSNQKGIVGMTVQEQGNSDGWIYVSKTVEVKP